MESRPVNLRLVRKAKARAAARAEANSSAARHGRSRGEKTADAARAARFESRLDGHCMKDRTEDGPE